MVFHAYRVRVRLVRFVYGHDERQFGLANDADGFFGLGLYALISRHDEDGDVGDMGAARSHGGEGLMSGRVNEGNAF